MTADGRVDESPVSRVNAARAWLALGPRQTLVLLLVVAALLRMLWLAAPDEALIFDEKYYVNAARVIAGYDVQPGEPYADAPRGEDPNREHPPLGKLLIAGSMRIFGDTSYGWRAPSIIAGVLAILLLYALVAAATRDRWLALFAAGILAFDNLAFVHGRIATLDMPFVALLLAGAWCWVRGRPILAGVACAFAAMVKLTAIYGLVALLALEIGRVLVVRVRERRWWRAAAASAAMLGASFVAVWVGGMWALDLAFTSFRTPWDHLRHMLDYGFAISRPGGPANTESRPWQWLLNEIQMPYMRVNEDVVADGAVVQSRPVVDFRGAMNPVVIGAAPLAFGFAAWRAWHVRDRLSLWVVAWVGATYVLLFPLAYGANRTMYIFYFLITLPAVAVSIAQLLRQSGLPRVVGWAYGLAVLVGFLGYFPFRRVP
jgi:dolichyl-phosphate-mannose-protein mannosyltransferase